MGMLVLPQAGSLQKHVLLAHLDELWEGGLRRPVDNQELDIHASVLDE